MNTTKATFCSHTGDEIRLLATRLPDAVVTARMADLFKAMADPTRVRIIGLLADAEVCVGDLCLVLGMSQPAGSHHLKLLRLLNIVQSRKEGQHVFYRLVDDHVLALYSQAHAHVCHEAQQESP